MSFFRYACMGTINCKLIILTKAVQMKVVSWQPVKFVAVGLVVASIDVSLTHIIATATGTRVLSASAGFFAGLIASYILHATVSFSSALKPATQIPRFAILVSINYATTIGVILFVTDFLQLATTTGKLMSLPIVAVNSYFISKYWVFSKDTA